MIKPPFNRIALVQLGEFSDILTAAPIAKYYHDKGFDVYFPIYNSFVEKFEYALNYINWIPIPYGLNMPEITPYLQKIFDQIKCDKIIWLNEYKEYLSNNKNEIASRLKHDEFQYWISGVPLKEKWNLKIRRNKKLEDQLYRKLVKSERYILVSNIKETEIHHIKERFKDHQIVSILNDTENPFDWLKIIEKADYLLLNQGFYTNLIEQLNIKKNKILSFNKSIDNSETRCKDWEIKIKDTILNLPSPAPIRFKNENCLTKKSTDSIQANQTIDQQIKHNQSFDEFTSNTIIVVTTYNRSAITRVCLENLSATKHHATLVILDDHSTDYDISDLKEWSQSNHVVRFGEKMHVDKLRAKAHEIGRLSGAKYIYHTDNDAYHDPLWLMKIYEMVSTGAHFVGLFSSKHHTKFTVNMSGNYILRTACPGISFFYELSALDRSINFSNRITGQESNYLSWDFVFGNILGLALISSTSYVEHFGADGIHNKSFDDDTAMNPSNWLKIRRNEILKTINTAHI